MVRNELKSVIENNSVEYKEKEVFLRQEIDILQTEQEEKDILLKEYEEK
jgi:hypothetical protein